MKVNCSDHRCGGDKRRGTEVRKTKTEVKGRCDGAAGGGCRTIRTMTVCDILFWAHLQPCLHCLSTWSTLSCTKWTLEVARGARTLAAAFRNEKICQSNKERLMGKIKSLHLRRNHHPLVLGLWNGSPSYPTLEGYNFSWLSPLKQFWHYIRGYMTLRLNH